jgi:hypothetical protein
MTTFFYFLLASLFAMLESKILFDLDTNSLLENVENVEQQMDPNHETNALVLASTQIRSVMERHLQVLTFTCPGGSPPFYFTISIVLTPQGGYNTNQCTTTMKQSIGVDINAILYNYGLGDAGEGDNAAYSALVCENPTTARRRLVIATYIWKGGGACRQCTTDNFDRRRLYDPNWFRNIYAPEMQNVLRNAITQSIVPNHVSCLGSGPVVSVTVQEVSSASQVPTTCN